MPHYIRFLKAPRIASKAKKASSGSVTALITITSDLGDCFLAEEVELVATVLIDNGTGRTSSFYKNYVWASTDRQLQIEVGPVSNSNGNKGLAELSIRAADTTGTCADSLSGGCKVISAWSAPFPINDCGQAEKLVQRRFSVGKAPELRIWEETGNSIARHIWDAALSCVMEIQTSVAGRQDNAISSLPGLAQNREDKVKYPTNVNVMELGTGCGIVGIAMAQILPRCSVFLTDLEEAREIVCRNAKAAKLAPGSTVRFEVLDWDRKPSDKVCRRPYDLIVVSDCTYNADSMPSLVRTLRTLTEFAPETAVLVALKRRHESEGVFFALMEAGGFATREDPKNATAGGVGNIEIYCFSRQTRSR